MKFYIPETSHTQEYSYKFLLWDEKSGFVVVYYTNSKEPWSCDCDIKSIINLNKKKWREATEEEMALML